MYDSSLPHIALSCKTGYTWQKFLKPKKELRENKADIDENLSELSDEKGRLHYGEHVFHRFVLSDLRPHMGNSSNSPFLSPMSLWRRTDNSFNSIAS